MGVRVALTITFTIAVVAALLSVTLSQIPEYQDGPEPYCSRVEEFIGSAHVEISARVNADEFSPPRIFAELKVIIPSQEYAKLAGALRQSRDFGFTAPIDCIIGVNDETLFSSASRIVPPEVVASANDTVEVVDRQYVDVLNVQEYPVPLRYFSLESLTSSRWRLSAAIPTFLLGARTVAVQIDTPAGWLSSPSPYGIDLTNDQAARWEFVRDSPVRLASVTIVPDFKSVMGSLSYSHGLYEISSIGYIIPHLLAALFILAFYRRSCTGPSSLAIGEKQHLRRIAGVAGCVTLLLCAASAFDLVSSYYEWPVSISNYTLETSLNTAAVDITIFALAAVAVLLLYAPRRGIWVFAGFAVVFALVGLEGANQLRSIGFLPIVPTIESRAFDFFARLTEPLLIICLISGLLLHMLTSVWRTGIGTSNRRLWTAGTIVGLLALLEGVLNSWRGAYDSNRLYGEEVSIRVPILAPLEFLRVSQPLFHFILLGAVWQLLRGRLTVTSIAIQDRSERNFAALCLTVGPMPWYVDFWGWRVPFIIIVGYFLATALMHKSTSVLERHTPGTGLTIRDSLRLLGPSWLRTHTIEWQARAYAGRVSEKALRSGDKTVSEYLTIRHQLKSQMATPWPSVAPLDALIAVGPETTSVRVGMLAVGLARPIIFLGAAALTVASYATLPEPRFSGFIIIQLCVDLVARAGELTLGVFALGLMWSRLAPRRGALKPLLVALGPVTAVATIWALRAITNESVPRFEIVKALVFVAVLSATGVIIEHYTLQPVSTPWRGSSRLLLSAYGIENLTAQFTFILAQVAAVLAIYSFVTQGGDPPSYPSIDPFQLGGR